MAEIRSARRIIRGANKPEQIVVVLDMGVERQMCASNQSVKLSVFCPTTVGSTTSISFAVIVCLPTMTGAIAIDGTIMASAAQS